MSDNDELKLKEVIPELKEASEKIIEQFNAASLASEIRRELGEKTFTNRGEVASYLSGKAFSIRESIQREQRVSEIAGM